MLQRLAALEIKHENNPNLDNILKREKYDREYHIIDIKFNNRIVCFYCGVDATGYDHVPPISHFESYMQKCIELNRKPQVLKLSCCAECNILLNNTMTTSLIERLSLARFRIKRKYYGKVDPKDRITLGRLGRRLSFNRGINRTQKKYL